CRAVARFRASEVGPPSSADGLRRGSLRLLRGHARLVAAAKLACRAVARSYERGRPAFVRRRTTARQPSLASRPRQTCCGGQAGLPSRSSFLRAKAGGEGRNRTFPPIQMPIKSHISWAFQGKFALTRHYFSELGRACADSFTD